jgi:hypothetical protein
LSASEVCWSHPLQILCKLQGETDVTEPLKELNAIRQSQLVNEDPVTCVIYFNKLVDVLQHRGSPQAYLLIWMEKDPLEEISEDMINTVALIDKLCSVSSGNVQNYGNQVHKHMFTF